MNKKCERLAYASWKTRLRGAVHHLAVAATLWESCKEIAKLCEDGDPRKKHLEAMKGDDPNFAGSMEHQLLYLCDELQEAELRGEDAMKARHREAKLPQDDNEEDSQGYLAMLIVEFTSSCNDKRCPGMYNSDTCPFEHRCTEVGIEDWESIL